MWAPKCVRGGLLSLSELDKLYAEIVACSACQRLVDFRHKISCEKRAAYRHEEYWGKPVPGFGDANAQLLIVGLAPAAHGGNRTGRVFTGDGSADFLMQGLYKFGFANQPTSVNRDDGLQLINAYVLAAVRCVPPDNKPTPEEILTCRPFMVKEMALLPKVKAVLALGKIGMDSYINSLPTSERPKPRPQFGHGVVYDINSIRLFGSYHPSRQNTQTGRLTKEMFGDVLGEIKCWLKSR